MKVLVIPGYYGFGGRTPSGSSGSGVFFRDQAVALARAGHDTSLIYVHFDGARGVSVEKLDDDGLRSVFIHAAPWRRLNSLRRIVLMARAFREESVGNRPDVIHAHIYHALPAAWALSRLFHVPYVVTEHSSKVREGSIGPCWRVIARLGYARAGAVVAVSEPLAQALSQYTRREVAVVPNLVRDEFFTAPLHARNDDEPFTFLSVGYCDRIKGWDILLHAFAGMEPTSARLVLCGEDCPELRDLADRLGIGDRVRFMGRTPPELIPSIMAAADCHVMASRVETFGIASIEALACGKPIIMTATDAASAILTAKNGLPAAVEDERSLTTAMEAMMARTDRFDPSEIRESCRSQFAGGAVASQLLHVFARATSLSVERGHARRNRLRAGHPRRGHHE